MKRKICVVTGTRAEYGLLYWLMKEIEADSDLELQIIATGMHLSPEFGSTYKEIEKDFKIDKKIEMLLSSDTSIGISKSMGLAQISFAEAYEELKPDMVVVLGDRYEIFSAMSAAMIARIPIAHLHGGETTEGAFDESIRHSITKISHIHFTATDEYRNRVIQLGEHPSRVFNVGGMGIENIKRLSLLSKDEFENSIDFKLNKKNILVTFHPVTLENSTAKEQFQELLDAIDYDNWCYLNSLENVERNNCKNITVVEGDASALKNKHYDIIIANINRNILLNDMTAYAKCLNTNGVLFLSGFYNDDIPIIEEECNKHGLKHVETLEKNHWVALKFVN